MRNFNRLQRFFDSLTGQDFDDPTLGDAVAAFRTAWQMRDQISISTGWAAVALVALARIDDPDTVAVVPVGSRSIYVDVARVHSGVPDFLKQNEWEAIVLAHEFVHVGLNILGRPTSRTTAERIAYSMSSFVGAWMLRRGNEGGCNQWD